MKKTHHPNSSQYMKTVCCIIGLVFLGLSPIVGSIAVIPDLATIKDTARVQNIVEIKNISDTIKAEFLNDTVAIAEPIPVGKIIYAEHKSKLNVFLDYAFPIIMLLLGVCIDRCILIHTERKRNKREGLRWKSELDSLRKPLQLQKDTFDKFTKEYCDVQDRFDIPSLSSQVLLNCEIFDSLNKEDLYKYLLSKQSSDRATAEYHKIIQVVSSIKSCQQNLHCMISEMKSESNKLINQFNQCIQDYFRKLACSIASQKLPLEGAELSELYRGINDQMPNVNPFLIGDSFIQQSKDLLKTSQSEAALDLIFCLNGMQDIIQGLKNEKTYIRQNLEQLIQAYNQIEVAIASIKF